MTSLDDELGVPATASLSTSTEQSAARLVTKAGAVVSVSRDTCTLRRPDPRCLLIGRQAATADLRIQHGSISRKHAILYYNNDNDNNTNNALVLKDLGSKHGTTVNGQRVQGEIVLHDGDSIFFGNVRDSVFTVKYNKAEKTSNRNREGGTSSEAKVHVEEQQAQATSHQQAFSAQDAIAKAGEGLSGRSKRQAEIDAMMASLDQTPTYQKVEAPVAAQEEILEAPKQQDKLLARAARHAVPVANRFTLACESERRKGTTTCLAVDPAGARFAVGSTDTTLRFFDFGGMDRRDNRSFCTVIPEDGHWLVDCSYSNTGDRILVGTGSVQPVVLDRDGETVIKFVRGDMYVTDQSKTAGHTAALTAVDWHPLERDVVLTASMDGSARLWNLNGKTQFQMLVCDKVFQAKNAKGQRTAVTSACFHPAGREFALGTVCGSIQIWNRSRVSGRPERAVFSAHGSGKPISSLTYAFDGSKLLSRSVEDDTAKVWNAQRLSRSSEPLVTCEGVHTDHERSNAAFSPDAVLVCAPVASTEKDGNQRRETGGLNFYNVLGEKNVSDPLFFVAMDTDAAPIIVKWHPKLNQIFVGCSNGQTVIFYDPRFSSKGALLAACKAGKRVDDLSELLRSRAPKGSAAITGEIITPLYQNNHHKRRKRKAESEQVSLEPERPATGKHKTGGQVGGSLNFQQFIADQSLEKTKEIAGKDPREALFKYKDGKSFVARAYEGNESKLADKTAEQEEEESKYKK